MNITRLPRIRHLREDGWLAELISMNYRDHPFTGIHSYVVSITPGRSRANHYHGKKEEWIAPAAGIITLHLRDMKTGESATVLLDTGSDEYGLVRIPPGTGHSLVNSGTGEASVIVFSTGPEDPGDTFPCTVSSGDPPADHS